MKVYFRLCKGTGLIYDRLIRWYTRGNFTHAEFAWPLTSGHPGGWLGAQPRGGVKVRDAAYLNCEYEVRFIELNKTEVEKLVRFLERQIGKPYDWKAIFKMGCRPLDSFVSHNRWFCSELVFYALAHIGKYILWEPENIATRLSPRDLGLATIPRFAYRGYIHACNFGA